MKLQFRGAQKRADLEHNQRAWLAWHVAALQRQKKLPRLETLLSKARARVKQTWQQQDQMMMLLAARMERAQRERERQQQGKEDNNGSQR